MARRKARTIDVRGKIAEELLAILERRRFGFTIWFHPDDRTHEVSIYDDARTRDYRATAKTLRGAVVSAIRALNTGLMKDAESE